MSSPPRHDSKPITLTKLAEMRALGEPIVMVTAYDHPSARLASEAGVDLILVGDSVAMVVLGYDDTLQVTVGDLAHHTGAVARGLATSAPDREAKKPFVVADLPWMSYHTDTHEAVRNAAALVRAGAHSVKLEGGRRFVEKNPENCFVVPFLVRAAQGGFEQADPVYEEAARTLGRRVVHLFDRGYAGGPWLAQLISRRLRFVMRWPKRMKLMKEELQRIVEKFGDTRRSEITSDQGEFTIEDLIAEEDMVVTVSHTGYIKRTSVSTYRKQRRGGRGVQGAPSRAAPHRGDQGPARPVLGQPGHGGALRRRPESSGISAALSWGPRRRPA